MSNSDILVGKLLKTLANFDLGLFFQQSAASEGTRNPSSAPFPSKCITCHANAPNPAGQRTRVQLQMTACGRRAFDDLGTDHAEPPDPVYHRITHGLGWSHETHLAAGQSQCRVMVTLVRGLIYLQRVESEHRPQR